MPSNVHQTVHTVCSYNNNSRDKCAIRTSSSQRPTLVYLLLPLLRFPDLPCLHQRVTHLEEWVQTELSGQHILQSVLLISLKGEGQLFGTIKGEMRQCTLQHTFNYLILINCWCNLNRLLLSTHAMKSESLCGKAGLQFNKTIQIGTYTLHFQ